MSRLVPSQRNNNLIAESDYMAAVAAIEARFDSTRIRPNVEHPQVAQALVAMAQQSLTAHLARVVQVVSDEAYHVYKHQVSGGSDNDEEKEEDASPIKDDSASRTAAAVDYRFDESELIDQAALEKVQALREQVRELSAAITARREALLERSLRLADRQLQLWQQRYPERSSSEEDASPETNAVMNQQQPVQEMTATVQTMLETLRRTKTRVPKALSSLQETTLAIQQNQKVDASGILQPRVSDNVMMLQETMDPESILINAFLRQ